jgi:hypothetical protein
MISQEIIDEFFQMDTCCNSDAMDSHGDSMRA